MKKNIDILKKALLLSAIFLTSLSWSQKSKIELVHADTLSNSTRFKDAAKLKGNVHFKNQHLNLYCDSAFFHQVENWVRAYGRVQINQGDTLNLYSDSLFFDGNTNIGKLQSNVKIRDNLFRLNTDSLSFNANTSIAYYTNHAHIKSNAEDLTLTSRKGQYNSNTKTFIFKDSVVLNHPVYLVHSDTLEFKALEEDILIHGPSSIYLDSTIIETKKAIFHTLTDDIVMWRQTVIHTDFKTIKGDSVLFNNTSQDAKGFGNVSITDTVENVNLYSDVLHKSDSLILLIGNAQIFQFQDNDTLAIQADTIIQKANSDTDQTTQIAQSNVIIQQAELIGICDSLYYNEQDSVIKLQKSPIIWRENTELVADSIEVILVDKTVNALNLYQNAFVSMEHDSIHYDQCAGKFIYVLIDSNKIQRINIVNNAETIYFPSENTKDTLTGEEEKTLKGINYMISNSITLYFTEGEIHKINFLKDPDAIFQPIKNASKDDLYLKKFKSYKNRKPEAISKKKLL